MIQMLDLDLGHDIMTLDAWGWQPRSHRPHTLYARGCGTSVPPGGDETCPSCSEQQAFDVCGHPATSAMMPHTPWHGPGEATHKWQVDATAPGPTTILPTQLHVPTPSKKVSRHHISSSEWASRRSEITDLYRHRGWTLPRVMQEMSRRGFNASKKQYKNRITEWGLDKNVKRNEAEAILREHRRLNALGQPCIFVARGWLVDVANLERFSKRARLRSRTCPPNDHPTQGAVTSTTTNTDNDDKITSSIVQSRNPSHTATAMLPPEVRCIHLPQHHLHHPITAPSDLETLRALFHYTSVLFHSFFDRDVYALSSQHRHHNHHHHPKRPSSQSPPINNYSKLEKPDYSPLSTTLTHTQAALSCLQRQQYAQAGELLDRAFAELGEVVCSNHPNGISVVIKTVGACVRAGFGDLAGMVVRFVGELGRVRFGGFAQDPRGRLYALLPRVFEGVVLVQSTASGGDGDGGGGGGDDQGKGGRARRTRAATLDLSMTSGGAFEAQGQLVGVYELFCQDLWRKKRPEGPLLLLLWYPGLFSW